MNISLPKVPKITKTVVLITLGVVVLLALISYGIVRSEQAEAVRQSETARVQDEARRQAEANRAYVRSLEAQAKAGQKSEADAVAICSWIDGMAADKSRRLVSPPLCQIR